MKKTASIVVFILCLFTTVFAQDSKSIECINKLIGEWEADLTHEYFDNGNWDTFRWKFESDLNGLALKMDSYMKLKDKDDWQKLGTGFFLEDKEGGDFLISLAWLGFGVNNFARGKMSCKNNIIEGKVDAVEESPTIGQGIKWTFLSKDELKVEFTDIIKSEITGKGEMVFKRKK